MRQSKKIAVTGRIGSGKSALTGILKERGYPVFSCDEIYLQLLKEREFLEKLYQCFPDCFEKRSLNKTALSRKVFSDGEELKKLNAVTHPLIMERLISDMSEHSLSFAEVPLLYEGGFEELFDEVIAVKRNTEASIAAVMKRSGLTRDQVSARMARQYSGTYEEKNCIVVENDGTISDLERRADILLQKLSAILGD